MDVNTIADALLGDEAKALNTVGNAVTGKQVSSGDALHAAYTLGADALMLVPGLGWGLKAVSLGSKAAKATKAAKLAGKDLNLVGKAAAAKTVKQSEKYTKKAAKNQTKLEQVESKIRKTKGMQTHRNTLKRTAEQAYKEDAERFRAKKNDALKRRNSPRRKKARRYGHLASGVQNVHNLMNATEEEE